MARPDLALVTKTMVIVPTTALHQKGNRFFNLVLIGVAFFDDCRGHAVRAEDQFRLYGFGEPRKGLFYFFDQSLQIKLIAVEGSHAMNRNLIVEETAPLIQAAAGRSRRKLWIHGQQDDFLALVLP